MTEKKIYICNKCDTQFPKWSGRCTECGAWGSLGEELVDKKNIKGAGAKPARLISGADLKGAASNPPRLATGINEIDRVFGGGLVPGSLTLLGGEPGIGKSTVVAQIADKLSDKHKVTYVSGEESAEQIAMRLARLGCDLERLNFITETEIESICAALFNQLPEILIIDSIQTVRTIAENGEPGGVGQIRASTVKLLEFAKGNNVATIIIGHITKDGQVAGPKTLEHLVDTVIYLETDSTQNYRIMRSSKNRFGATSEVGIFEMTGTGLSPINNPAALFLEASDQKTPGTVITAVIEGTRPFLLEVQALTNKTMFGYPQRRASGMDANRLNVLAAVMGKRARVNLAPFDIIVNIVGGLKINDPSLDLAVCLAIASSLNDKPCDRQMLILGEVGLGGEIRPVPRLEAKLQEAVKMGFTSAITPKTDLKIAGLDISPVSTLSEALEILKR